MSGMIAIMDECMSSLIVVMNGWMMNISVLHSTIYKSKKKTRQKLVSDPNTEDERGRQKKKNKQYLTGRKTGYMYNVLYVYQGQQKLRFVDYHTES